ncbi:MAG: HD domain-containing protein [Desulfamplus sp.]|nr:HD domain-containing protein [Desulfamplus sp.]
MPPLKKILKPRIIAPMLDQAAKAAGPGIGLALAGNANDVLYTTSSPLGSRDSLSSPLDSRGSLSSPLDSRGSLSPPLDSCHSFPILIGDETAGHLLVWGKDYSLFHSENQFAAEFGKTLALMIQEMVSREYLRRCITDETLEQYREVALFQRMALSLNSSLKMEDVTRSLLAECRAKAEMGMIFYKQQDPGDFTLLDGFGPVDAFGLHRIVKSRLFQEIARGSRGEIVNDLAADSRWQEEVAGIFGLLCIPLHASGEWSGALVLAVTQKSDPFNAADLKRISAISSIAATSLANAYHFQTVQQMLDAMIQSMATAIDSRDPCTSGHSRRVAAFTLGFADMLTRDQDTFSHISFNAKQQEELFYAAMLHDVGKIGIREEVLTKSQRLQKGRLEIIQLKMALWGALTGLPWESDFMAIESINGANTIDEDDIELVERLSRINVQIESTAQPLLTPDERVRLLIPRGNLMPDEWEEIRRHPEESCRILESIPFPPHLQNLLTMVRQHHEKLNGRGYPDGLEGEDILMTTRMIAIVDVYDALTAKDRPYKKAIPRNKALEILQEESGAGHLDPELVDFFCRNVEVITKE